MKSLISRLFGAIFLHLPLGVSLLCAPCPKTHLELRPDTGASHAISVKAAHTYAIRLHSGEYLHVVIEQRGIDLALELRAVGGDTLRRIDRWPDIQGEESISWVAYEEACYLLIVKPSSERTPSGRYSVTEVIVRPASAGDQLRVDAESAWASGDELYDQATSESKRRALAEYERSLALWRSVGDTVWQATVLNSLGVQYFEQGEVPKSIDYYREAATLARTVSDPGLEGSALSNLGRALQSTGSYEAALDTYKEALPLVRWPRSSDMEAYTFHNIAMTYRALGDFSIALHYFQSAVSASHDRGALAHMRHHVGEVLIDLGEYEQAENILRKALAASREIHDRLGEATCLNHLGRLRGNTGHPKEALVYLQDALEIRRSMAYRLGEAETLQNVGIVKAQEKAFDASAVALNEALSICVKAKDLLGQAVTLKLLAETEMAQGNPQAAETHIENAVALVEEMHTGLNDQELRTSYFGMVNDIYHAWIRILASLDREDPSNSYGLRAFEASEQSRARTLLETIGNVLVKIHNRVDHSLLADESALRVQLNSKSELLLRLFNSGAHPSELQAIQSDLEVLKASYSDLESQIIRMDPNFASINHPKPLRAPEIRDQVLDPGTVLLEYCLDEEQSFLWVLTVDGFASYTLPGRGEINRLVRRAYRLLSARGSAMAINYEAADQAFQRTAQRLSKLLLAPAAGLINQKRIIIVADGSLQYLPFGALPDPSFSRKGEPLMVGHELVNAPSASTLAYLRNRVRNKTPKGTVAVLADPVFDPDDLRVTRSPAKYRPTMRAEERRFSRLPLTRREADEIVGLAGKTHSFEGLDFDANGSDETLSRLSDYRIVHFATHGTFDSNRPALSGLVLSLVDRNGMSQPGFLSLEKIYNLDLSADMVVLSACQTALGRDIKGEGMIGITRGFMYAGANHVVASLWQIDDSATTALMKEFYANVLSKHIPPAAALRKAQIRIFQSPQWKSPYFWAAFVLEGDWSGLSK